MKEDLAWLMSKCRDSARTLTGVDVLERCRAAAEQKGQSRIRTTSYFRTKMNAPDDGGRSISWSDVRAVAMSATSAVWQEDHGRWALLGGEDNDGEPLTVIVMVIVESGDVHAWNAFAPQ